MTRAYSKCQNNLKVGDRFRAILRFSDRSYTLGGEQKAGTLAYDGEIFKVTKAKRTGYNTGDYFFGHRYYTFIKVKRKKVKK